MQTNWGIFVVDSISAGPPPMGPQGMESPRPRPISWLLQCGSPGRWGPKPPSMAGDPLGVELYLEEEGLKLNLEGSVFYLLASPPLPGLPTTTTVRQVILQ